jgi:multidrug efflux pump subunit AcrB
MRKLIAAFARNTVFANIILLLIFMVGGLAATSMIRETFPEFSLDMIDVKVFYPGADPEEVEEGISRKIEESLDQVEGIKQYTTRSSEGAGTAMIEVKEDYDIQEVLDKVRSAIDSISTFPVDAEKPIITEMTVRRQVLIVGLSGEMPERRLKEWAERIKDELQQLPEVTQVEIFGTRDYEIGIEVSEEKLRQYGLTFQQVSEAVRRSNLNMAGGTIRTEGEEIRIRTIGRKYTGKELASIVVLARPEGEIITLDRLAKIDDGFAEDPIFAQINGRPGVYVMVFKTQEEDSLVISKAVEDYVERRQQQLPGGVHMDIFAESSVFLKARIDLLLRNGLYGLLIVFLLLWFFLDLRLSVWAGLGMPISVAGALGILWALGGTINMISLFGLIMVLGIIVDDAIVVGEAIYVHRKRGEPPLKAAVEGVSEVGMPVIAAVVTTIVAFLPLMYVGGIMGKFIAVMPVVVISCLAISLVECLIILPAHLSHLPDLNTPSDVRHPWKRRAKAFHQMVAGGLEWFIGHVYSPFVEKAIHWRYVSLCVALSILIITLGLIGGGIIKFLVFPKVDGTIITSHVEFPNGTPADVTTDAINRLQKAIERVAEKTETVSGENMIEESYSLVGMTLSEMPSMGPNVGSVMVELIDSADRGVHSDDLMVAWEKEAGALPGVQSLTFEGLQAGPPGAPIEIWLQGQDMDKILAASEDLMNRLRKFDGVYQIRSDFQPGKNELRLELKPEARTLGLTVDDLARQVNAGYFGAEALRLQRGRNDIRVRVRYTARERGRLSDLDQVRIRTPQGYEVPLFSVANAEFAPGYSTITRTDGMRRVAVSAEVDTKKANTNEILAELDGFFQGLESKYPGLYVSVQGEKKKMRESFDSLYVGFPIAVLGIFVIIATIFRSYLQPFVIMFTVPFGIIGAVWGHLIMGFNLSLLSVFGMVALTGVVVNDAIVLIERINNNIAEGMSFFEAIKKGGARRFRAILLTSLSTIGGLTPLILEKDLQAQFLIPMALSIAAGVAFATVLTLVLIPSLLVILNDFRLLFHRLRYGEWIPREGVEPARERNVDLMNQDQTKQSQTDLQLSMEES